MIIWIRIKIVLLVIAVIDVAEKLRCDDIHVYLNFIYDRLNFIQSSI